jgi:predicted transcriptional regulator
MVKADPDTLSDLARRLDHVIRSRRGFTQAKIAKTARITQPLVSRALNGKIKRETKRVKKLMRVIDGIYANMQNIDTKTPTDVGEAVKGYLASGGDPALLIRQVDVLRQALAPLRRSEMPSLDEIK